MSAFMLMLYIWSRFALPGKEHIRESAVIRVLVRDHLLLVECYHADCHLHRCLLLPMWHS
jgi:hypothetical protein